MTSIKSHFRRRTFRALCATTAVAVLGAVPAYAQDNDEEKRDDSEIIVTAQFRAQSVQEAPLAITAISAETLEARSQTDIRDIAAQAPFDGGD